MKLLGPIFRNIETATIEKSVRFWHVVARLVLISVAFPIFFADVVVGAPALSPEIIDQLRSLPREQQLLLAGEYGVDLAELQGFAPDIAIEKNIIGDPGKPIEQRETDVGVSGPEREEDVLRRYGTRVFDKEMSTFAPVDNIPVPEGYLLGPGDTLNITLYGTERLEQSLQVGRDGTINFPRLGAISLTGLNFREAKQLVTERVTRQMIGTEAIVSMGNLRSINVFLAGEVRTPGTYSVSALSTLTQALYVAGGVTEIGSLRKIELRRQGDVISRFDLYDLMLRGDLSSDRRLLSGDVIFVPSITEIVGIDGAVRRPGFYELKNDETVGELIAMAGGVGHRGFLRNVRLTRYSPGSALPVLLELDLENSVDVSRRVMDGDLIQIDEISNRPTNAILFSGAVARPGIYAWSPDARISDFIRDPDADLFPYTDLGSGLVIRRRNARLEIDVISFVPSNALGQPTSDANLRLQPHDEVMFFPIPNAADLALVSDEGNTQEGRGDDLFQENYGTAGLGRDDLTGGIALQDRTELLASVVERLRSQASIDEPAAVVSISGAVRVPGVYPLIKDGQLGDLLRLSGGLRDYASLDSIEVRRIRSTSGGAARVEILSVSVNDSGDANEASSIQLQSRDHVKVSSIPGWSPDESVTLTGEFVYPGDYLISPGETIGSVVRRAGGVTRNAFLAGAHFTRLSVKSAEKKQLENLANSILRNQASRLLTSEDGLAIAPSLQGTQAGNDTVIESLLAIETEGRLVIDLKGIVDDLENTDIEMQSGDILEVPRKTNAITVVGEVSRQGSFRHEPHLRHVDYIELAGGLTSRANKGGVYIIKANGRVVFPREGIKRFLPLARLFGMEQIEPGDTLIVPIDAQFKPILSRYREISTVVFQTIASAAALISL